MKVGTVIFGLENYTMHSTCCRRSYICGIVFDMILCMLAYASNLIINRLEIRLKVLLL